MERSHIIRCLYESPQYTGLSSVFRSYMPTIGYPMSADRLRTVISWLEEQGLVDLNEGLYEGVVIKLTERGRDVAAGRVSSPGLADIFIKNKAG